MAVSARSVRSPGAGVTVTLDGKPGAPERLVSFVAGADHAAGEFDKFRHGYAGTIYKGQGRTLDQTYLYHSEHWRNATSYVALTRHRENIILFVATETASDLGRLARQMARVDDCRAASQFHTQENPEPGAPVDLAVRRAQVEEAADRRRQAEHQTLTKAALADSVPGGRRRATVEDVACELSPEYADRVKYGERLGGLIARTEKAMRYQEGIARGRENGVDLRWWRLSLAQKTLHVTGVWRDQRLDQYENGAAGRVAQPSPAGCAPRDIDRATERQSAACRCGARQDQTGGEAGPATAAANGRGRASGTRGDLRRLARAQL